MSDYYVSCGDWVESCTAFAERNDGRLEIITWSEIGRQPRIKLVEARAA